MKGDSQEFKDTVAFFNNLYLLIASNSFPVYYELRAIHKTSRKVSRGFHKDVISLVEQAFALRTDHDVYFSVAPKDKPDSSTQSIHAIPALWVDVDYKDTLEQDMRQNLLSLESEEQPTYIINSGNGLHMYWLLHPMAEPVWEINDYLYGIAKEFGGDISSAEMNRILRVPNTFNHKYDPPRKTFFVDNYLSRKANNPLRNFKKWCIKKPARHFGEVSKDTDQKGLWRVLTCDFIKWCRDNPADVTEPLWYAMVSNLSRFKGGVRLIHKYSTGHPGYTQRETNFKIARSVTKTNPHTCDYIRAYGYKCKRSCQVRAPAAFARI